MAQVERADGLWLQGQLLEQGVVQVQNRPSETSRAAAMLARERSARLANLGFWTDPTDAPRDAGGAVGEIGTFQIVRDRVHRVHPTDRFAYLMFRSDWRSDVTLRRGPDLLGLEQAELDPLRGRLVEVRGLVLEAQGALISLSHSEQLGVLR